MRTRGLSEKWSQIPPPSRHPFQLWVLGALVLAGIGALLGPDPQSVQSLLPDVVRAMWALSLLFGGTIGLLGAYWKDAATGLLLERSALLFIAGAATAYGLAVLYAAADTRAGVSVALVCATALGLTLRYAVARPWWVRISWWVLMLATGWGLAAAAGQGTVAGTLIVGVGVASWRRAAHVATQLRNLERIAPKARDD